MRQRATLTVDRLAGMMLGHELLTGNLSEKVCCQLFVVDPPKGKQWVVISDKNAGKQSILQACKSS